jgi:hypothetical protein
MNLCTKFQVSTTYRLDANLLQTNKQKTALIKICVFSGETINNALASDSEMKESSILQAIEALNSKFSSYSLIANH